MENPSSVQTKLADICAGNCGHLMRHKGFHQNVKLCTHSETMCQIYCIFGPITENFIYEKTFLMQFQMCEVLNFEDILSDPHLACAHFK